MHDEYLTLLLLMDFRAALNNWLDISVDALAPSLEVLILEVCEARGHVSACWEDDSEGSYCSFFTLLSSMKSMISTRFEKQYGTLDFDQALQMAQHLQWINPMDTTNIPQEWQILWDNIILINLSKQLICLNIHLAYRAWENRSLERLSLISPLWRLSPSKDFL